jgi:iron-sulfur cluster repair protein YtfE (RIC family)
VLLNVGKKKPPEDVVEMMLECHGRIREMVGLARRLAELPSTPAEEARDVAARVRRYFSEALPRHVADEEESVVPRLRGASPEVDRALDAMCAEHVEHGPELARLVSCADEIARAPERLPELGRALGEAATALERAFAVHLEAEERVLFPALAALDAHEKAAILAELRARRAK